MQADNPFAAPQSLVADPSGSAGAVSPGVVETLRRTKGWVRELARDSGALEGALEQQRAFWRLVGVISLASILLYALLIVGGVGAAMVAGMKAAA
jgi:hypothetical protein